MKGIFLKAEWRKLVMVNYAVDPNLLTEYLPHKTELDIWNNTCYVSLVGFMFVNTRLLGFKIPYHTNFEEVNLRFYVRYKSAEGWRRGVVFIKEIVPRYALTFVANTIYRENYETMRMNHRWVLDQDSQLVEYKWRKHSWSSMQVTTAKEAKPIVVNSEEEFITEHFWGYTKLSTTRTSEYQVEHPRWDVYEVKDFKVDVDFQDVYGKQFSFLATEKPKSLYLAEGSEILVRKGSVL
jgi:uncharacterized protein